MRLTLRRAARRFHSFQIPAGVLMIGAATVVRAQSAVRLGDLYAQVEGNNARIAAAQALVRAAQARIPGAKRPPDPQVQFGLMNYSLPGLTPMVPLGMTQLQVMQMIPLGGKLGLAARVADAQADATSIRAQDVSWEL